MKPHIARWRDDTGVACWGVWLCGLHLYAYAPYRPPNYLCTQLSVIADILRGRALAVRMQPNTLKKELPG